MTVTPFDTVRTGNAVQKITDGQRRTLRQMALEKADLIGKPRREAEPMIDTWLASLSKDTARIAIQKLGAWLDHYRAKNGIPTNVWKEAK